MTNSDMLTLALKAHHQSVTAARRAVFDTLQGEEPLTMQQIVTRTDTVNRASVYRAIALFEQIGIVQRLQTGWKYRIELSDAFHAHHHHATCKKCGRTITIPEDPRLEQLFISLAQANNFQLTGHQLELQGICSDCKTATTA